MYLHKWSEALVDWVNCLALTPKIIDLSELENGFFFSLLLKNVIPGGDLPEIDPGVNGLDAVFSYLENEFPHYGVQDIKSEGKSEVVYISSLLLFLSVTKGDKPSYFSQLCHDLQHDSQVKIKCFLESCIEASDGLNHAFLKSVIEGDYVAIEQKCQRTPKRRSEIMKTPLKEFLDSPRLTDKLSRDLRRLQSEKEALQLEKMELEDELRTEKEKREELEENLSEKSEQVVKLREELLEYAQSMDELMKGDDANNLGMVETLESELKRRKRFMDVLAEERDILSQEKNSLQEKQALLLERMKRLEAQAIDSERANESLQLSLSLKEQELLHTKTYLGELKEKLQLMSTQHNASLDSDTSLSVINNIMSSPFSEGERLSQAVVDLKLAEVEADNERLKSLLDVNEEQSQKLRSQLEEVKEKLEKVKIAQEAAMAENNKKQEELIKCIEEKEALNVALVKANDNIFLLTETNSCLKEDNDQLKNKVVTFETQCCQLEKILSSLEDDLRQKHDVQQNTLLQLEKEKCALASSECKYKELQERMNVYLSEKEELQVALKNLEENYSILNNEKQSCVSEISEIKNKLTLADESNISLKAENSLLIKEIDEKQKNVEAAEKELQEFKSEAEGLKSIVADAKIATDYLNEILLLEKQKNMESEETLEKFVGSLEDEMQSITQLEGTENLVFPHDMRVAEKLDPLLTFFKKYHLSSRSDRENLASKNALLEKEVLCHKDREQEMMNDLENCKKQLSDSFAEIHSLQACVADLKTNLKKLNEELSEKENEIAISLKEKEELQACVVDLKTNLKQLNEELSEKENQIAISLKEKEELQACVADLKTNLKQLNEELSEKENQIAISLKEKEELQSLREDMKVYLESPHSSHDLTRVQTNADMKLGCQLEIDSDITRNLGVESKLWQVIRSGEVVEMFGEKMDERISQISCKIAELWDVLARVQLKCNEAFLTEGSGDVMGRNTKLSKELCMQLEKILIKMEKQKVSLELEKMHAIHKALSGVYNGVHGTFDVSPSHEDCSHAGIGEKPTYISSDDQGLEIPKSLELLEDKFAIALAEVASTANIFMEVERSCSKAEDALEYLRSQGKLSKKMMVDTTYENNYVEEDKFNALKTAYEETVTARLHLERICRENQDELHKCHVEKVALQEEVDHLKCELEICSKKIEWIRDETMEDVRKEYEKKVARMKKAMEMAYQEDFEKFTQESERCKQLQESCKKYKNLLLECHKNLSDMKVKHKNMQQKMEALENKNHSLEEKLFESQLNFGRSNFNNSMSLELNRSQSAEQLSTYFARGDLGALESMKFSSENRLYPLNASGFSKGSGRGNLPSGQVFCTEDEEGESFNATFLSDLKEGRCEVPQNSAPMHRKTLAVLQEPNLHTRTEDNRSRVYEDTPNKRLKELVRRNTLCLPHLKSSYPAETQTQDPRNFPEDSLKSSSLKAPLLSGPQQRRFSGNIGGDLRRKKDKGQIAYMKPGPPTPGKNRRSSLQDSDQLPESKVQSTPGRLLSWFGRRRRSVWDAEVRHHRRKSYRLIFSNTTAKLWLFLILILSLCCLFMSSFFTYRLSVSYL
ncbi:early endosome antigen 1-like isoform X2 [Ischnura elegans]|uniref:early endosome antigen 1-like isoform X2 n=1 Tax=Ischnura elegans TaxID=197161 RepID=UPI001ED86C1C|nr:early endosome antigen 1-like isoform X2 [Ischnura elegans]